MKRLFTLVMALVMVSGCSTTSTSTSATTSTQPTSVIDGTYQGSARGNNGDITVSTTITDGKISDVTILSDEETNGISDTPLTLIPQRIVENNSVNVDTIVGATMTSTGIINAVKNALESNGIDLSAFSTEVQPAPIEGSDTTTQVVVIGSGAAGIRAATVAAENGMDVILVEKQDILGGTSLLSASMFGAVGTKVQQAEGLTETTEDLYENYMKPEAATGGAIADSDAAYILAKGSTEEANYLLDLGVELDHTSSTFVLAPAEGKRVGEMVIPAITQVMEDAGVDVRISTRATHLLIEDGKATGIEVETKDGNDYTITADAVIIATGGFAANREMVSEYLPQWSDSIYYCSPGDTGDAVTMAKESNLELINMDLFKANPLVFYDGTEALTMNAAVSDGAIMVNHEGNRFVNEQGSYGISPTIKSQTNGEGIILFDETEIENDETMQQYLEQGYLSEFDSIDALAQAFNIDADALKATIAQYQTDVANGVDSLYGRKTLADLYSGNKFYGIIVKPSIQGTFGGIHTNVDTEVYDTNGTIVNGLYAVGECAAEGVNGLNPMTTNFVFGRIAGNNAAEYVSSLQ